VTPRSGRARAGGERLDSGLLEALVRRFRGRRVLVLADLVADEFVYGRVERISREAPVLILRHDATDVRLGGGANAVHNIRTLGARPLPFGVVGDDAHGRKLRALLREKRIPTTGIATAAGYETPVKTRVLAGRAHSTKQQVVRLDRYAPLPGRSPARRSLERALRAFRGRVDGVLVSDYGCGLLDASLVRAAVAFARRRRIPVTVDSRFGLLRFRGMTAATPNEAEVEEALSVTIGHDRRRLEAAGKALLRRLACQAVLVTRGSDGMALFERGRPPLHIDVHGTDQVADVTGAGDTVIATFTLALAAGALPAEAARLANYAGGIVVMKRATATVSADELVAAVRGTR
jgi:rfaE bifunctional protein kinase chain/domain